MFRVYAVDFLEKHIKVTQEPADRKYSPLVLTVCGATTCVVKRGSRTIIIHEGDLHAHHHVMWFQWCHHSVVENFFAHRARDWRYIGHGRLISHSACLVATAVQTGTESAVWSGHCASIAKGARQQECHIFHQKHHLSQMEPTNQLTSLLIINDLSMCPCAVIPYP